MATLRFPAAASLRACAVYIKPIVSCTQTLQSTHRPLELSI